MRWISIQILAQIVFGVFSGVSVIVIGKRVFELLVSLKDCNNIISYEDFYYQNRLEKC